MCNNASSPNFLQAEFFDQMLDRMESAAGLECANLLVILTLEEESEFRSRCTWSRWVGRYAVKSRRCEDWGAVNVRLDNTMGFFDGLWS
jgi:hypothetical protein